jgi:drug/metabolite transporter (DMT)-like permease
LGWKSVILVITIVCHYLLINHHRISGLKYISVVKASLFASLHPLMLVIVFRIQGKVVSFLEWTGTFVTISGMALANAKALYHAYHTENVDESAVAHRNELIGMGLCLLAAASETLVLLNRVKTKTYVPLMQVYGSASSHNISHSSLSLPLPPSLSIVLRINNVYCCLLVHCRFSRIELCILRRNLSR